MSNSDCKDPCGSHCQANGEEQPTRRPRRATLLNMSWLKERLAKAQHIKERLNSSSYQVDSEMLAKALLNKEK